MQESYDRSLRYRLKDRSLAAQGRMKRPENDDLQKRQAKSDLFISSGPFAARGVVGDAVAESKVIAIMAIDLRMRCITKNRDLRK